MTTMKTYWPARGLAVSKDGRWIAAATGWLEDGATPVWDTTSYKQVFKLDVCRCLDFLLDSTRLVTASRNSATVWDLATGQQVHTLHYKGWPKATKHSPHGDRIAIATKDSVRVWDSNNGRLLVRIKVKVITGNNKGLLWSNNHLFVVSDSAIKEFEASTGLLVSEWPVADTTGSCIALSQYGEFIAYSTNRTITFWNTSTHTQLGLIQHPQDVVSIVFSPDDHFLAIGGSTDRITIRNLEDLQLPSYSTLPFIEITDTAFNFWKRGLLADAEASLTQKILNAEYKCHHALANRALVRAHRRLLDLAIDDAEKSINIRPSAIGYIAKSVALIGNGQKEDGLRVFDLAFRHCDPIDVDLLLLIKAVVLFVAGEHDNALSRVDDLIVRLPFNSTCYVVHSYMYLLLGSSHMETKDYERGMQSLERARAQMRNCVGPPLMSISLISGWKFGGLGIMIQRRLCEALYATGRTNDAVESLLKLVDTFGEGVYTSGRITDWVSDFTRRCLSVPESDGGATSKVVRHDNSPVLHVTRQPLSPTPLLREWAKATLASRSWKDTLVIAASFTAPRFAIYCAICEQLEGIDRITDATECFHEMESEWAQQTDREQGEWMIDFKSRRCRKLEDLGDLAMSARQHDEAIDRYSTALSLNPANPQILFVKRSKARANLGLWKDALNDANEVIIHDPSSPFGYERKHAALRGAGCYDDAIHAFETMLLKMSESSDPEIRERSRRYVNTAQTEATIREAIENAIRELPLVLINTDSGRLLDKSGQASSFESQPAFHELVSSMTTDIDRTRIRHEVAKYYRYATFSHKWKDNEPLFEKVIHMVVYNLEESPTHDKLQMFCKLVRDAGFHWAWSDTCCINKMDPSVLQEALVSMFQWYHASAMTIVLLCDVCSPSRRGDLVRSIWNTRAWTFQEYHASKVVRFYNKDWSLYRGLDIPNHKESPEIISEMEEATGVSARALMALRPGLEDIRQKLRLASTRRTTRIEDAAYSLLGIFSLSLPVVYGEGDKALGRLLAQLLMSSGDTSILAWTGKSGNFNSCLPASMTVFRELPTSHVPLAITGAEMEMIIARMLTPSLNRTLLVTLYERLNELPVPFFVGKRMKLPCLVFKLGPVSATRSVSGRVFRAKTNALGTVEIRTTEDLSRLDPLYLVHPWIDFFLDRQPVGSIIETTHEENADNRFSFSLIDGFPSSPGPSITTTRSRDAASLLSPSSVSQSDKEMRAFHMIARLWKPFGALLFTPSHGNVAAYRRVASESPITVQVEEMTLTILNKLVDSVRVLDVL
ncbi:hypothetical protein OG21DRAFT_1459308 [Imleria badia]|nr:hypothetical protein OG21DRAFT_1459308 [Imleria badia]